MSKRLLWLLLVPSVSLAQLSFNDAVNQANALAKQQQAQPVNQLNTFDPNRLFDHYTQNPKESQYYGGITQNGTHQMTTDAMANQTTGTGAPIFTSMSQHPHYVFTANDPSLQHANLLQTEADHIVHGVTDQYIDCQPKTACQTQYQTVTCEEVPQTLYQSCKKTLTIQVLSQQTVTHYPLVVHLSASDHTYAGVSVNSVTGQVTFIGPHEARFTLNGRLPSHIDCNTLMGAITQQQGASLDYIHYPSCSNGLTLDFHFSHGHSVDLTIDITSTVITHDTQDQWIDQCQGLANEPSCTFQSVQCVSPKATRVMDGVSVTRDCWENQLNYLCRQGMGQGNCQSYSTRGCEQVGSTCLSKTNITCDRYQQTYRCPIKTCAATTDVVCGNGEDYCLNGNCTDHSYAQSQDFARGASALSAVQEASTQLDPNSLTIFTGYAAECSEKPVGYSNCCADSGWEQDIGLDHCPAVAKKLHVAKDNKQAIYVGSYCSGADPFPCLEHAKVYCVFDSKLAKIIQEQGRSGQLNIGFGSASAPNCAGITTDQLQQIDFSRLDFTDYVNDLMGEMPTHDLTDIQGMIKDQVQQQMDQAHG